MGSGLDRLRSGNGCSGVVSGAPSESSPYVTGNRLGEV